MKTRKKVLLVDDVRLFLKLEETFFKRTGCDIMTAQSGSEAISIAKEKGPDLILLDYIMPDMMGDEVCKSLKGGEDTKEIPIIIVSTSAGPEDIEKCFKAGADDYVTKPINATELLAKAAIILKIPQRIHNRIPVNLKVMGETSGMTFTGFSKNISQGGILVECRKEIPEDAQVSLDLPILPDMDIVNFTGKVVRAFYDKARESYDLGIEFYEVPPGHADALKKFIGLIGP